MNKDGNREVTSPLHKQYIYNIYIITQGDAPCRYKFVYKPHSVFAYLR